MLYRGLEFEKQYSKKEERRKGAANNTYLSTVRASKVD